MPPRRPHYHNSRGSSRAEFENSGPQLLMFERLVSCDTYVKSNKILNVKLGLSGFREYPKPAHYYKLTHNLVLIIIAINFALIKLCRLRINCEDRCDNSANKQSPRRNMECLYIINTIIPAAPALLYGGIKYKLYRM